MRKPKLKLRDDPERQIRDGIKRELTLLGWTVFVTHGNEYQHGLPDLYCMHPTYGTRWVEVKNPTGYSFTVSQMEKFPLFSANKVGIWILTGFTKDDINKLFGPPNWWAYLSVMK